MTIERRKVALALPPVLVVVLFFFILGMGTVEFLISGALIAGWWIAFRYSGKSHRSDTL